MLLRLMKGRVAVMTEQQQQMLDHAIALLVYLLGDSPKLRDRDYQHRVRQGINEALRRYIEAA